jgi:hypothetical protein
MEGTPVKTYIRAIPKGGGWVNGPGYGTGPGEQFYELTGLPWKDQQDIRAELDNCGFFVQDIYFADPMPLQVGLEIRNRIAAEQESKK